ncbi:MAG: type II toxin-antitoxin system VapC family toxin [Patescibacteria group bacterium]
MLKPTYVIDASTCLKWVFNDEIFSDQAIQLQKQYLLGKINLLAPTLWFYEIANGIKSAALRSRISSAKSKSLLGLLLKSKPETVPMEEVLIECLENAIKFGISAYDSAYITLAKIDDTPLITSDQKLVNKMSPSIKMVYLRDYTLQTK